MLDAIGFAVTREGNGHWFIATPPRHGAITAEEAAGLTLIAPHIRRAVEISRVLGVQRLEAETCRAALGQLDSPVLILGPGRGIAFANPTAERAIEGGRVLRRKNGALHGATEQIERLLGRIAAASGPASVEETVTGTDGEERLVFAVRLDVGGHVLLGEPAPFVLLVMRSPREDTRNPVAIAAQIFGLTPAQVQVLGFLAQGHAPEAIADILGISVATVRSHLSALFDRTGTSRQAELVARTLSLASPLRPAQQE
jgi:DNA-binding CsgD family transcriptional regulator